MQSRRTRQITFRPPVESRSDDELIGIANSTTEYWQQEIITQARQELEKRGVSKEYEHTLLDKWSHEAELSEIKYRKLLDRNASERYTWREKLTILALAPIILLGRISYGTTLSELKAENFRIKFRQRLVLLIVGVAVWFLILKIVALARRG